VYNIREKILNGFEQWRLKILADCEGKPMDPKGPVKWESLFGSKVVRARHLWYESVGFSSRGRAGMDFGFLFGLASNAIPAAGWMLMHILDPKGDPTLLERVLQELRPAKLDNGTLDIPTLISLPLLQSIYFEILRLYVDVLVTREVKNDLVLPVDDENREVLINKGFLMVPSWPYHHDDTNWFDPPADVFCAERYLKRDPESGKEIFSATGTGGKMFPYGGGRSICPGRVFAKQEILASVAMILLEFEFEFVDFLDNTGKATTKFPGLSAAYPGSGVVVMSGDMKVRIKRSRAG
jgi:hypothetical protein